MNETGMYQGTDGMRKILREQAMLRREQRERELARMDELLRRMHADGATVAEMVARVSKGDTVVRKRLAALGLNANRVTRMHGRGKGVIARRLAR